MIKKVYVTEIGSVQFRPRHAVGEDGTMETYLDNISGRH